MKKNLGAHANACSLRNLLTMLSVTLFVTTSMAQIVTFDFNDAPEGGNWSGFVGHFVGDLELSMTNAFELSREGAPSDPEIGVNGFAFFGNTMDVETRSPLYILDDVAVPISFSVNSLDVSLPAAGTLSIVGSLAEEPLFTVTPESNTGLTPITFPRTIIDQLTFMAQSPANTFSIAIDNLVIDTDPDPNAITLACDMDGDGDCEIDDLNAFLDAGDRTAADIEGWLSEASTNANIANPSSKTFVLGDLNLNGTVDSTDLGLMLNNFGSTSTSNWDDGNLNDDGGVNSTDLGLLLNNFNFGTAAAAVVPEPNVAWLLFVGSIAFVRRRKSVR